MADRVNPHDVDVAELARNIVNHAQFRSALDESVARQHDRNRDASVTTSDSSGSAASYTSRARRRSLFNTPEQEVSFVFGRGRGLQVSCSSAIAIGRSRSCSWQCSRRRGAARRSQSSGASKAVSSVCKQVILLSDPCCDSVPRQSVKAKLIEEGFVLNAFLLDKQWSAPQLYNALKEAFFAKLEQGINCCR